MEETGVMVHRDSTGRCRMSGALEKVGFIQEEPYEGFEKRIHESGTHVFLWWMLCICS
jgi:hypothetical protein